MTLNRLSLLTQLIDLLTSTVSYQERLENFVNILSRYLKVELTLFFALDKNREKLFLSAASRRLPWSQPPLEFCLGVGIVGATAQSRKPLTAAADDPQTKAANQALEQLVPKYRTLFSFPIADDNFLYGVLLFVDKGRREFSPYDQETILIACRMLAANIRQALLHEEAKKRIAELSVLFDVAKAISSTMELDDLLNRIASISAKVLNARGASLRLVEADSGQLQVSATYGEIPSDIPGFEDLTCQVIASGEEAACITREIVGPDGQKQFFLGVPLQLKGNFKGMLCVYNKMTPDHRYQQFDPENRQFLQTLAGMASSSIENALAFQQIENLAEKNQRMVQVLTVLHEISSALLNSINQDKILNVIVRALTLSSAMNYDRAMIFLVDKATNHLEEVRAARKQQAPPGLTLQEALLGNNNFSRPALPDQGPLRMPISEEAGILARTVLARQPFHVVNAETDPRVNQQLRALLDTQEFVSVPLLAKDEVIGAIVVDNYQSRRPFKEEDLNFLIMFANQAALALENAHLVAAIEASSRELTLMRERMLESDRLAAMSSMADGLAHEIRNPLVSIGGFARRISKQVPEDDPLRQYVDVIVEDVARLEKILKQIFDYTGDALGYFQEHEINNLLEDALALVQRDLDRHGIQVVKDYSELPPVFCDDRQIKLVFFNIFQNAQQAMDKGGTLTIRTFPLEKPDGLYAAIAISDTGGGIPPELVYNIFNPFFTTKEQGTGLGLSIAQRIVSRHYGDIEINNELGKGITFTVTLPIAKYCLLPPRKTPSSSD